MQRRALVTGAAGFIGSHLVDSLLADGWQVDAVDSFDPFYDPRRKRRQIARHHDYRGYALIEADIRDLETLARRLSGDYDVIVHLAARAGVRPSIREPLLYQDVNVRGTHNLLELARHWDVRQFVFASSSSVYGVNPRVPWCEDDPVLEPISPYAATKVSGELLGRVYSHLFGLRFIALRFFTVYGPRQRPDLAIHTFAELIRAGEAVPVFGDGSTRRDYTFCADTVQGIRAAMGYDATPYEIINLGNNQTVGLLEMIRTLENALGRRARLQFFAERPGDVPQTWASLEKAQLLLGYAPATSFRAGIEHFVDWLTGEADDRLPAFALPIGDARRADHWPRG
jgi:UDP-glucuronate 4-epimerase